VVGTASERNHNYLRSLGAIPVTYGDGLADRIRAIAPQGVDAAIDSAGRGSLPALVALVGDPDRVITLADPSAGNLGVRFASGEPDDMPGILSKTRRWWRPARSPCRSPAPTLYATRHRTPRQPDRPRPRQARLVPG
jgi:NADPH:quinone reductase-like Zn-dependent oxidoreductase